MAAPMKFLRKMAPVVVILGATGTGKSKLAIEIAAKLNGEIISADSMQIYKSLDIVTNKVTREEQNGCPHHLIDCVSPLVSSYTVADFRDSVLPLIDDLHRKKKLPIIVGGTNYYIESLLWNFTLDVEAPCDLVKAKDLKPADESPLLGVNSTSGLDDPSHPHTPKQLTEDGLHRRLMSIDPDSALRIHPNDTRKLLRALEIYEWTGQTKSRYLQNQQNSSSIDRMSGPLRFSNVCMIWIQCQQKVLDDRIEKRVDEMIERGLLAELSEFHLLYNGERISNGGTADYTHGIFQTIGFKELHDYLLMSDEERQSEHGVKILHQGVDGMKAATRRYARRQLKWIVNRFIKRKGDDVLPVYALDSTNLNNWQSDVVDVALDIVSAFLDGRSPKAEPVPHEANTTEPIYRECTDCDLVFVSKANWDAHISGRRHKKTVQRRRQLEKLQSEIQSETSDSVADSSRAQQDSGETCSSEVIL